MDDQDRVLVRFPHAQAVEEPPIFRHGDDTPVDQGYWSVLASPDPNVAPLGFGPTEEKAWADAARKLRTSPAA